MSQITFIPYNPAHIQTLAVDVAPEHATALTAGPAFTVLQDGAIVGCVGAVRRWEGNFLGWSLFDRNQVASDTWPIILGGVRTELVEPLAKTGRARIAFTVPSSDAQGCELAYSLGLNVEALMPSYGPDGVDHFLFTQILPPAA
jgi:hypothetical protein